VEQEVFRAAERLGSDTAQPLPRLTFALATKDAVGAVVHGMIVELDYDRRSLPSSQRSSMFAQDCDRRSDAS